MKNGTFTAILYFMLLLLFVYSAALGSDEGRDLREIKRTVELNKDGEVSLETYKGTVSIGTWDSSTVKIEVKIEPDGMSREDIDKVGETDVRIDSSPGVVRIKSDYDRVKSHFSLFSFFEDNSGSLPFVNYTITMPTTARLRIKDYKSDSRIENIQTSIDMETYKGTVEIHGFSGEVDLETYKGKVRIDAAKLAGSSRVETQKGDITVALPEKSAFDISTDLGRRATYICDFETPSLSSRRSHNTSNTSARMSVNGGGPLLHVGTEKGTVRLIKSSMQ